MHLCNYYIPQRNQICIFACASRHRIVMGKDQPQDLSQLIWEAVGIRIFIIKTISYKHVASEITSNRITVLLDDLHLADDPSSDEDQSLIIHNRHQMYQELLFSAFILNAFLKRKCNKIFRDISQNIWLFMYFCNGCLKFSQTSWCLQESMELSFKLIYRRKMKSDVIEIKEIRNKFKFLHGLFSSFSS